MARPLPWLPAVLLLLATSAGPARAGDGVVAELPFLDQVPEWGELGEGHVAIDVSPNPGRPFPILLDTGAQFSLMTPRYARSLGVSVRAARDRPYRKATLLGRDLQFYIDTTSSDTGARTFEAGLLGGNFLEDYVVEVDYAARRVRFLDPRHHGVSETTAEPGEIVVPMRLTDMRPEFEITLGNGSAWFLADTGAPHELSLAEEEARRLGIAFDPEGEIGLGTNLYGADRSALTTLDRVSVGGHVVEGVSLAVALRKGSSYRITNVAGVDQALLGNAFLRRFRVRFDYPNRRVGLLPVAQPAEPATRELQAELPHVSAAPPPSRRLPTAEDLAPARMPSAGEEHVWLELRAPDEGLREAGPASWVEVRGFAGAHRTRAYDVVIALDVSGSTAYASGADVDGDGKVGKAKRRIDSFRSFNPNRYSSDLGDTVLAAELAATRRLIEALDPERTRIGLVTFSDTGVVHAPVGSDRATLARLLTQLERSFGSGYTNFAGATRAATEALLAAGRDEADPPQRVILLLSDGYPTFPGSPEHAAEEALEAAQEAAAAGVTIHTFGLGLDDDDPDRPADEAEDAFVQMAARSGGTTLHLAVPGEVVEALPRIRLADVASVEVQNLSAAEPGRATRIFPDGSFDSFVALVPGENRIRVVASGDAGGRALAERVVFFEQRPPTSPEEARAFEVRAEALRRALETRSVETELAAQAEHARQQRQEKELELRAE